MAAVAAAGSGFVPPATGTPDRLQARAKMRQAEAIITDGFFLDIQHPLFGNPTCISIFLSFGQTTIR
jgi:hypothetical protein